MLSSPSSLASIESDVTLMIFHQSENVFIFDVSRRRREISSPGDNKQQKYYIADEITWFECFWRFFALFFSLSVESNKCTNSVSVTMSFVARVSTHQTSNEGKRMWLLIVRMDPIVRITELKSACSVQNERFFTRSWYLPKCFSFSGERQWKSLTSRRNEKIKREKKKCFGAETLAFFLFFSVIGQRNLIVFVRLRRRRCSFAVQSSPNKNQRNSLSPKNVYSVANRSNSIGTQKKRRRPQQQRQ